MSYMRGDLLTRMRKLVKGLACPTPIWLKAMEEAPPVVFPRVDGKIKKIEMPEDVYVKRFFKKHPDSLYHDAVRFNGFDPPPARLFAWRVLDLKEQGVNEEEAMAVADMEYMAEKKAKKKAYSELKKIARLQGKKAPPNPYPSPVKEIQKEEKKYVKDRFFNPKILEIVAKMKAERAAELQERMGNNYNNATRQPPPQRSALVTLVGFELLGSICFSVFAPSPLGKNTTAKKTVWQSSNSHRRRSKRTKALFLTFLRTQPPIANTSIPTGPTLAVKANRSFVSFQSVF